MSSRFPPYQPPSTPLYSLTPSRIAFRNSRDLLPSAPLVNNDNGCAAVDVRVLKETELSFLSFWTHPEGWVHHGVCRISRPLSTDRLPPDVERNGWGDGGERRSVPRGCRGWNDKNGRERPPARSPPRPPIPSPAHRRERSVSCGHDTGARRGTAPSSPALAALRPWRGLTLIVGGVVGQCDGAGTRAFGGEAHSAPDPQM